MEVPFIVVLLVLLTGFGFYRLRRAEAAAQRYLEAGQEAPMQLSHLSERLARVASDTRLLRVTIEGTLHAVRESMEIDLTRTEDDLANLDAALLDLTREVGLWLAMIDGLPAHDREHLESLGAGPEGVRGVLKAENWAFERPPPPGLEAAAPARTRPGLDLRIEGLIRELGRVESALQGQGHVYR